MPGVAAIVNRAVPGEKIIQLFYNTDELNLGVVLKAGNDDDDPDKQLVAKATDRKGIIVNPCQIGAAEYLGFNLVVGITQPTLPQSGSYTLYNVSIISPVYRPLTTTEKANTSTALCSSGRAAYAYYLKGPDASSIKIHEFRIDTFGSSVCGGTTEVRRGTALAAYCVGTERYVIYQSSTSRNLHEYHVGSGDIELRNTNGARIGTAMAVTYTGGKAYLYYTDDDYNLRRIVKGGDKWGPSDEVLGSEAVDASSHLAVTTTNGKNNVFYVKGGGAADAEFSHVRDSLA